MAFVLLGGVGGQIDVFEQDLVFLDELIFFVFKGGKNAVGFHPRGAFFEHYAEAVLPGVLSG